MRRRAFLQSVAAAAIAIPLAPLAARPRTDAYRYLANYRLHSLAVVKASVWLPVSQELLDDLPPLTSFLRRVMAENFGAAEARALLDGVSNDR